MKISEILKNIPYSEKISPLDAEILFSLALNMPPEFIFAHPEKRLTKKEIMKFKNLVRRRIYGEPIAYIKGKKEFYGLEFEVNKNVLIPRPDTEIIVERALREVLNSRDKFGSIIDIGTGSGNIIISLYRNIPAKKRLKFKFFGTDISDNALTAAKKNAKKHGVKKSIKFIKSDLLKSFLNKSFNGDILIVANLPYVSGSLYKKHFDNLKFEPKIALLSGRNGLRHYLALFVQIAKIRSENIKSGITCLIEIDPKQKNMLKKMANNIFRKFEIGFFRDLAGKTRIVRLNIG